MQLIYCFGFKDFFVDYNERVEDVRAEFSHSDSISATLKERNLIDNVTKVDLHPIHNPFCGFN